MRSELIVITTGTFFISLFGLLLTAEVYPDYIWLLICMLLSSLVFIFPNKFFATVRRGWGQLENESLILLSNDLASRIKGRNFKLFKKIKQFSSVVFLNKFFVSESRKQGLSHTGYKETQKVKYLINQCKDERVKLRFNLELVSQKIGEIADSLGIDGYKVTEANDKTVIYLDSKSSKQQLKAVKQVLEDKKDIFHIK